MLPKLLSIVALTLSLEGSLLSQAPDPSSLEKIWYKPQDCKKVDESTTRCKKVIVFFAALRANLPSSTSDTNGVTSSFIKPQHPDASYVRFHFVPKRCKPFVFVKLVNGQPEGFTDGRYVCKDVWWEDISKPDEAVKSLPPTETVSPPKASK